jgi:CHASE2 domain-containing sensor protein
MKNPLKRWDVFLTLLLFLIMIPAERYEWFSLLEDQTISFRHILRTSFGDPAQTALRDEIMIVALDEGLYEEYGSFPFRRTDLGKIAARLSQFGAKVIALDFLMDFRSSYGEDEPTAALLAEAGNVLLVSFAIFDDEKFVRLTYPTEVLNETSRSGYSNLQSTSALGDNLARLRVYDEITGNRDGWPFALQILSMYWGAEPKLTGDRLTIGDHLNVSVDQFGDIYIDFPRLDSGTQYLSQGQAGFSAQEILDMGDLEEDEIDEYRYIFADKIVLIGDTWEVTHDKFNTPVGPVYGVEIIADTVSTLLNGAPLRPASVLVESLVTATLLILLLCTSALSTLGLRLLLMAGIFVVYIGAASFAYVSFGLAISMSYALLAGMTAIMLVSLRQYMLTEQRQLNIMADSVESNRMLGLAYQGQGQLDAAFEKFRYGPAAPAGYELLYNLGLDFERKRQFNKALASYEVISQSEPRYRDIMMRIRRCQSVDEAMLNSSGTGPGLLNNALVNDDGSVEKPTLGRYQIEKVLGQGAMGVVYLGKDPKINRAVAIKTLGLSNEFSGDELDAVKQRFFREAESAGRLNHPNIVAIYDAGEESDLAYIAMELLKGCDLDDHIKVDTLLPLAEIIDLGVACAEALDYAHEQKVVHRDIKPSNIMYDRDNKMPKITDFGIARITDASKTRTGMVLGTPNYMSPEQCMGQKVDGRSDLFSLGVVLYQLCSGSLPFKGDSMATLMYAIVHDAPVDIKQVRSDVPPTLRKVIHNAMGRKPDKRYQTGKKLAAHLRVCAERLAAESAADQV